MCRSRLFEGVESLTDEEKEKRLFNYFIKQHYADQVRHAERFSAPQIGQMFGMSKQGAQDIVYRALDKLRKTDKALVLWLAVRRGVAL